MKYQSSFLWLFVLEVCCFDMIFQQCSFDRIHYIKANCIGLSFHSFISKYQQRIATPVPHFNQYTELRPTYDECPQSIRIAHYCVKLIWCVEANGWLVCCFLCLSGLLLEMYPLLASDGRFHACFFVVHPPPEKAIVHLRQVCQLSICQTFNLPPRMVVCPFATRGTKTIVFCKIWCGN